MNFSFSKDLKTKDSLKGPILPFDEFALNTPKKVPVFVETESTIDRTK